MSLAFSTKARDVRMVSICAALQAARMFAAPAVKLIIAGTRPADISAEDGDDRAVGVRQHDADGAPLRAPSASACGRGSAAPMSSRL